MSSKDYPTVKTPVGSGHVYHSDGGKQIRIFGEETTVRGPIAVMEKVAMRILHLVDRHGSYWNESDEKCKRCAAVRAFRKSQVEASCKNCGTMMEAPPQSVTSPDGPIGHP